MAKLLGLRHGRMTKFDRQILGNTVWLMSADEKLCLALDRFLHEPC